MATNLDQVKFPEAGILEGKPNSSLQLPQKPRRKQSQETKTSQNYPAGLANHKKAIL